MNEGNSNQDWKTQLRYALMKYFNEAELQGLCFDIDLDYDNIATGSKIQTVIQMIDYGIRTGTVTKLVELCEQQRPNVPWSAISEGAWVETEQYASNPTTGVPPVREPLYESATPRAYPPNTPLSQPQSTQTFNPNQLIALIVGGVGTIALVAILGILLWNQFGPNSSDNNDGDPIALVTPTRGGGGGSNVGAGDTDDSDISEIVLTVTPTPLTPTPVSTNTPIPTPTHTPTSIPTKTPTVTPVPTSGGSPVLAPLNTSQAAAWFPILNNLQAGGIGQVRNTDLYSGDTLAFMNRIGRLTSFERNYQHADFCESPDGLEDVYIQAFYFKDASGAVSFMTWATDSWTYPGVIRQFEIGDSSYYIKKQNTTLEGGDCLLEGNSFTFQKGNIVYRTVVYTRDGTWTDGDSYNYAKSIARLFANAVPD